MLDSALSIIAPHHCCGCDAIGSLLCGNCKYNISIEQKMICIVCHKPTGQTWLCDNCITPYEKVWVVGDRDGPLQRLIGLYKFERAKSAYQPLGDLLLGVLPELPEGTVIVPIPTTSARIRERGYDHMLLVAKYIARKRGLRCQQLVRRKTNTKQRHSSAEQRNLQAKLAFNVRCEIDPTIPYLLIDDVITTGATIKYASLELRKSGAKHVWVAVIARQVLK
jgi:ComF family protein